MNDLVRVMVTEVAGFIGLHLVERLLSVSWEPLSVGASKPPQRVAPSCPFCLLVGSREPRSVRVSDLFGRCLDPIRAIAGFDNVFSPG